MKDRALNDTGLYVSAHLATRHRDYFCPDCHAPMRLRAGPYRRPHFFHTTDSGCQSHGNSLVHAAIQADLQEKLRGSQLEVSFPQVDRIADVVWPRKKLIFEVQCSPIKPEEIIERNRDYRLCGYRVIWILHDRMYHKERLTAAERALFTHRFYYTNMDEEKHGLYYSKNSAHPVMPHKMRPLLGNRWKECIQPLIAHFCND